MERHHEGYRDGPKTLDVGTEPAVPWRGARFIDPGVHRLGKRPPPAVVEDDGIVAHGSDDTEAGSPLGLASHEVEGVGSAFHPGAIAQSVRAQH